MAKLMLLWAAITGRAFSPERKEAAMLGDKDVQATVAVKSLARAQDFYEGVLGLVPVADSEMGTQTYRAGGATVLVYESAFAGTNRATALTWALGDAFDSVFRALQEMGVVFERYGMEGAVMDGDVHVFGGMRLAWFKDPDGNIIHIGSFSA
jgi:catechol 2,3-dioxygenase-like lactoylglutathione lyase family enzyme